MFRKLLKNQKSMECGKYYKVALVASMFMRPPLFDFDSRMTEEWTVTPKI